MNFYFIILFFLIYICPGQIVIEDLGQFGGTGNSPGLFKYPAAIDISEDGKIFICDKGNHRIQMFDLKGNFIKDLGGFGWENEQFDEPVDIWARSTINIFVADYNNARIQRFDRNLNYLSSLVSSDSYNENYQFNEVLSIAYSPQGDIFILDAGENKIIKFNPESEGEIAFGYYLSGEGELISPVQIDLTANHQVIVSDAIANGIYLYDYFGNFLNIITNKTIKRANGITVDNKNRIYLTDIEGGAIFIFSITGKLIKRIDSIGAQSLKTPQDIAVYKNIKNTYNLYILDGDLIKIASLQYEE